MGNALDDDEQQQICALGRLGWTLLANTARHRCPPGNGQWLHQGNREPRAAAVADERTGTAKPAISEGVSTDSEQNRPPRGRCPPTSRSEWPPPPAGGPERERLRAFPGRDPGGSGPGRNAVAIWQDLVDDHGYRAGYASVKRSC